MKSIAMDRDLSVRVKSTVFVQYKAGKTYHRVPEAQARKILQAEAGKIVEGTSEP